MRHFDLFSTLNMVRRTDQQKCLPIEMYISLMSLALPDDIHEESPSFLDFENGWLLDGPTNRRTDRPLEIGRI